MGMDTRSGNWHTRWAWGLIYEVQVRVSARDKSGNLHKR